MPAASDPPLPRRTGRWVAIAIASLLLHLVALDLLPHRTISSSDDTVGDEPLRARLMPPITAAPPTPEPALPVPVPVPKPVRKVAPPRPSAEFVPESLGPVPEVRAGLQGSGPAPAAPSAPPPAVDPVPPAVVAPPAPTPAPPPAVAAVAPQSARLSYKVVRTDGRNAETTHNYGVGSIDWAIADGRYRSELRADVKILFARFTVMSLHSEGAVTATGLAPDRYTETLGKRPPVATNFNRDARQSITFSSSQASAPLVPGVQDRLSLLFQVGALLLASAQPSVAGTHVDMPVAGIRGEVETWRFESQGIESIETGAGPLSTTHLRRTPQPGTNDKTIDVWIAQAAGGYPARVLYTEPNGVTVEMTLEKVGAVD